MISSQPFQRSVQILTTDGELEGLDVSSRPFEGRVVALCRERCIFGEFDAPHTASARAGLAAARIHARTAAPFKSSGWLLTRQGHAFGIWWWDMDWVAAALSAQGLNIDHVKLLPEPFLRTTGRGARVVRTRSGFEAQLWQENFLIADSWRRGPFDDEAWLNFYRLHSADSTQPKAPPVENAVFVSNSPYRRTLITDLSPEALGKMAAVAFAVMIAVASGYFFGQAYQFNQSADRIAAEAVVAQAQSNSHRKAETQARIRALMALKTQVERPDPMTLLQAAQEIVQPFGYKISAFNADRDRVQFDLPEEAAVGVDLIATELNASPYFSNVRPRLDKPKKRLQIEMTVQRGR